ncbi:MAG TPA: hypothetical protein VFV92_13360 [Candidatus Bathyarchaeia archaeon]|nr:hypothetical protein [Candidatus Bathyarchaeia archaeon]
MSVDSGVAGTEELLGSIKRLTRVILDKLVEGSRDGSLDQAQTKLYCSILTRSLCLWLEALNPRPRRRVGRDLHDDVDRLVREMIQEKKDGP